MEQVSHIASRLVNYKNVVGFSNYPAKRIKNGQKIDEEVIRIYVSKKQGPEELYDEWILPREVEGFPIDVVEIGEVRALANPIPKDGRREVVRPLVSGISVGNIAITAGTLGVPAKKSGELFGCSNAHVLTPDPSNQYVSEQRIVQPGKYDDPNCAAHIIGRYHWHERIYPESQPSECPVSKTTIWLLNKVSSALGRRSRFRTYVYGENYQDFAVFKLANGIYYDTTRTFDFDISDYELVARLFAGSNMYTIMCKLKYQLASGYQPVVRYSTKPFVEGEELRKSGRTTGDTTGTVFDVSASMRINYGSFNAVIKDVVVATDMSAGGDSGSDIWRKIV